MQLHRIKRARVTHIVFSLLIGGSVTLQGITTFIPRSQGDNTARELVGWQQHLFQCFDSNYAAVASTIEYTRSFRTKCIANKLFSTSCLTFAGSQQTQRTNSDIVADYFGLATDFRGTLAIKPRIENIIVDINLYFGLDEWCPGMFLRVNAPITHTRWSLGLDDCFPCDGKFRGCTQFPTCYMLSEGTLAGPRNCPTPTRAVRTPPQCPVNSRLQTPRTLRNGNCTTQSLRDALSGDVTFGDMTEPWNFGRFSFCPRSKSGLADIDVSLGYNVLHSDCYHAGFFINTTIPTGNRPKARYIFEPLIGDGKHWKLGGGITTHFSLYPDHLTDCYNMGIYFDGRFVHVFKTDQIRSFDFKENGLLSRYILLKEYDTNRNYTGNLINAINFATRNCEVKVGFQADISIKGFVRACGWEADLGYNFYRRDREEICIKTECPCPLDSRIFGIKGVEGVCCQSYTVEDNKAQLPIVISLPVNSTQDDATMFDPKLLQPDGTIPTPPVCLAWNSKPILPTEKIPLGLLAQRGFILQDLRREATSPTLISCNDLDPCSAAQGRMQTHKVFGHLSYTFFDSQYCPFIGIGAEAEFDDCNDNALQQWGVWLKGGAQF